MAKYKFALDKGGPKRLELDYSLGFKNLKVRVDGREVGVIQTKKEWEQGRSFKLADGSTLNVQLTKSGLSTGLTVLRDGWPVPGSNTDPYKRLSEAYSAAFFVAFVNLAIGLGGVLFQVDFLLELGLGWFSVIFGLVFVGLGFGIRAKSKLALGAALAILVLDSALTVYATLLGGFGGTPYVSGIFVRIAILWMLWRGFDAISMLEAGPPSNKGMSSVLSGLPPISSPINSIGTSSSIIVEERKGGSWSSLEKGLVAVLGVLVLIVGGLIVSRVMPAAAVPPATAVLPTVQVLPTPQVIPVTSIVNDSPAELVLNISAVSPTSPMNIPSVLPEAPLYPGDLAWNKPVFASSYYADGYPAGVTDGIGAHPWRSSSSSGSWIYVDLGEPQPIHQIITMQFVDSRATNAPENYYIVSNDLQTWQIVVREINTANVSGRFQPRTLTLAEDVTARYVGLYAQNWGGGWGDMNLFAVLPPGASAALPDNSESEALVLDLTAQSATSPMNIPASPSQSPVYAGDLAWNKPTFASTFYADGYPSGATNDPGAWRTASSDGTWFYVDLGEAQTIHQIVVTLFVDSAFTAAPVTQYIVSNDLQTWQVVLTDVNTENLSGRFQPRLLTLAEDVTARYVGLYAADWGGGWGGAEAFSVFSPENTYTAESLREAGQP
jgi:hypothetical protein